MPALRLQYLIPTVRRMHCAVRWKPPLICKRQTVAMSIIQAVHVMSILSRHQAKDQIQMDAQRKAHTIIVNQQTNLHYRILLRNFQVKLCSLKLIQLPCYPLISYSWIFFCSRQSICRWVFGVGLSADAPKGLYLIRAMCSYSSTESTNTCTYGWNST